MYDNEDDEYEYEEKFSTKHLSIDDAENVEIEESICTSIVAFIDILGFKKMVEKDIKRVILSQRMLKHFCESYYMTPIKSRFGKKVSLAEEKKPLPRATMFSDSIIISLDVYEYTDFNTFVVMLAKLQFDLLSKGILIRGGVDIDTLYHNESFVFGSGLVSAYKIEERRAVYPRILVSDRLIEVLEKRFDKNLGEKVDRFGAPKNAYDYENPELYYLSHDRDGKRYINFLRYGLDDLDARAQNRIWDWNMHTYFAEKLYNEKIASIIKYINIGLEDEDYRVREKYIWLQNHYNETLDLFVNRARGKQAKEYSKKWAKRFIYPSTPQNRMPPIQAGDIVRINASQSDNSPCHEVKSVQENGVVLQSVGFYDFNAITAVYRSDGIDYKRLWDKNSYKRPETETASPQST